MSLCQPCRKAFPFLPIRDDHQDSITGSPNILIGTVKWSQSLFCGQWGFIDDYPLHTSWESLKTSISHDCPVCWTIWRCIRSLPIAFADDKRIADFSAEIVTVTCEPNNAAYTVDIRLTGIGLKEKEVQLAIWKTTEKWYLDTEKALPILEQHTHESVAELAKRWIKVCEEKHSHCLTQTLPPKIARMPTRLIDLGDGNSDIWRIHENPNHVPYIALSHRWSHETPTLLTSNYHNYSDCQSDSVLPQSYQDIFSICRSMAVQYLWVDSLCIIQDDGGLEFRREAPLMMDIYQYAFLTLTICWGFPGLGVFRKCRPRSIPRPKPATSYDRQDSVSQTDEYVFVEHRDASDLQADVDHAPLNNRAWVLQERSLSRRLLYLGNEQVYWECNECIGSEVSPDMHCPAHEKTEIGRQSMVDLTGPYRDTHWSWVLSKYTGYDLTFEEDRLIAIAGLAKLIASKTGDSYVAGIWLESWMQDLLWEPATGPDSKLRSEDENELKMQKSSRPSWSWLSFPGSVMSGRMIGPSPKISLTHPNSFESKELRPLALLSETVVTPPGSDPFTSFDRAILKIRCLLIPVRFTGTLHNENQPWYFRHELQVMSPLSGLDYIQLRACSPHDKMHAAFRFHFSEPVVFSSQYFLLPLYQCHWGRNLNDPSSRSTLVYGLVVKEILIDGTREFVRIGTWHEDYRHPSQLSLIISNTLVKQRVGTTSATSDESFTTNERVFDSKLGKHAIESVASKAKIPRKGIARLLKDGTKIEEPDGKLGPMDKTCHTKVECSLLSHLTTAKWDTISLV